MQGGGADRKYLTKLDAVWADAGRVWALSRANILISTIMIHYLQTAEDF